MAIILYWIVQPDATATPTGAQVAGGLDGAGGAALAAGSETYTAPGDYSEAVAFSGLTASTAYEQAWVAYDDVALTYSAVTTATITTEAATLNVAPSAIAVAAAGSLSGTLGFKLGLTASPIALAAAASVTGDIQATKIGLGSGAASIAAAGVLSGDVQFTLPTLDLASSPVALAGALSATATLQFGLPTLDLSASAIALSAAGLLAGDLAYLLPTLDLSANAIAVSGAASLSGDPTARLPFDVDAGSVSIAAAASLTGNLQISDAIKLDVSANAIAVAGSLSATATLQATRIDLGSGVAAISATGAFAGTLAFVLPAFDLSAAQIDVAGLLAISGDPRARLAHDLGSGIASMSAGLALSGDIFASTFVPGTENAPAFARYIDTGLNVRIIGAGIRTRLL